MEVASCQFGYTLGGNGRVSQTTITDPNGNLEQKSFDSNGFVTGVTYALGVSGVQQSFAYGRDPDTELITSVTDPLGRQTNYGYDGNANVTDAAGRLGAITDALGNVTTWVYDPLDRVTSVTDANGNVSVALRRQRQPAKPDRRQQQPDLGTSAARIPAAR